MFSEMKTALLLAPLLVAFTLGAADSNHLSNEEKAAGWKLLFNGKDTTGWRTYGRQAGPGPGWVVKDGTLRKVAKSNGGNIITSEQFSDYEFSWEWRLASNANSGVKYLVTENRPGAPGYEYQMIDEKGSASKAHGKHKTASFYDVLPVPGEKKLNPAGEWNNSRIVVKGNHVEHWLNGSKVLEFELGSEQVKAAVAKSKFSNSPQFGEKITGHIMLTDHGDEAWFRNIKIRELE